ncbi:uncharacterized protein LOC127987194 isoform X2 [Carassius gibelio]|uniref:uncharacterized protein LOC127987194 isoform X2 n=1 Tax=Carassius gibelio TaxID=101364 RepID=UPI00227843E0|nr:uncharacterized protein LOC127987194 isoform X2 [Carassius gibelio]
MTLIFVFLSACVLLHCGVFGVEEITMSVREEDVVTLHTGVKTNHRDRIRWYYKDIRIAQITGDLIKTCKDIQCKERFRDRLKLDNQTGSLTIMNIRTTDSGEYKLKILGNPSSEKIFNVAVHDFEKKTVTAKESETVTLCPVLVHNPDDFMTWYLNDTLIAEISVLPDKICTDLQCKDSTERFRDRLKLDHQTGSLIITDTRTTDSGEYKLQIISSSFSIIKRFSVTVTGSHVETQGLLLADIIAVFVGAILLSLAVAAVVGVIYSFCRSHKLKRQNLKTLPVMEGDSVTLNSDVAELQKTDQVCWLFGDENTLIAQIKRETKEILTHDDGPDERFRDRLKLDHQTGSLTITNTRTTDSGKYKLQIISSNSMSEKIFSFTVHDVPDAETDKMKTKRVNEGDSVTLDSGVIKNPKDLIMWYYNDTHISEIARDPSKICTGDECEDADGRFRDRLKLNNQTGSLTITDTRTTDSGDYHLEIITNSSSICRQYSIDIISEKSLSGTGSNGIVFFLAMAGACLGVLLVVAGVTGECRRKLASVKSFFYPKTNQTAVL